MYDFSGFENWLYEQELSPNSIASYMRGVKLYSEMFTEVSKANFIAFKKYLIDNFKPQTVNLRLTAMRKYSEYVGNPIKIKIVKEPQKTHIENIISTEQYEHLIAGLKADGRERELTHILLLAKTGMRISEALKVTKIDIIKGSVTMHTKAHMRTIYFPQTLVEEIAPYLKALSDGDRVMLNCYGNPITKKGVSQALLRMGERYGIPKKVMHPHAFRHFFAMEFIKRNKDIALLADLLGHGDTKVTQIYLRQSQEQQKRTIDEVVDW